MKRPNIAILMVICASLSVATETFCETVTSPQIGAEGKAEVIDSVVAVFKRHYVHLNLVGRIEAELREHLQSGKYDQNSNLSRLLTELSRDLVRITGDKHINLLYVTDKQLAEDEDGTMETQMRYFHARSNYGFRAAEILPGNVGYIDLRAMSPPKWSERVADGCLNMISNADAIIVDLRNNSGGSPDMVRWMSGAFLADPVHLTTFVDRNGHAVDSSFSDDLDDRYDLSNIPLFLVTGPKAASGAEELAYNLKHLGRAVVVGQKTAGAAGLASLEHVRSLNIKIMIPKHQPIHPVTGSNWEGTGVQPDIPANDDNALDVAHLEALKALRAIVEDPDQHSELDWEVVSLQSKLHPYKTPTADLGELEGSYAHSDGLGVSRIELDGDVLRFKNIDQPWRDLHSLAPDVYALVGADWLRLRVERNDECEVIGVRYMYYGDQELLFSKK